ncbi:MAG: hypothetical protein IK031_04640 [Bacteroidales bacterium]|nr:hypothetical protein [Bacteroidales bacterium]
MKKNYKKPFAVPVQFIPELMLATSDYNGSGEDAIVDTETDFDSFFGA